MIAKYFFLFISLIILLSNNNLFSDEVANQDICPFITTVDKKDLDFFTRAQNYFKARATMAECQGNGPAKLESVKNVELVQSGISKEMQGCINQKLVLDEDRTFALSVIRNGQELPFNSSYRSCQSFWVTSWLNSKEKMERCIDESYQGFVANLISKCRSSTLSTSEQNLLVGILSDVKDAVTTTPISSNGACGMSAADMLKRLLGGGGLLKPVVNLLPGGTVAANAIDVVTDLIPTEKTQLAAGYNALLLSEQYEQSACLFFDIQKTLYCPSLPKTENSDQKDGKCPQEKVTQNFLTFLSELEKIKNSTGVLWLNTLAQVQDIKGQSLETTDEVDTAILEMHLDDFSKHLLTIRSELRDLLKKLPKIKRAREEEKLNNLELYIERLQLLNLEDSEGRKKADEGLKAIYKLLYSNNPAEKIDFSFIMYNYHPKLDIEKVKKDGLLSALNSLYYTPKVASSNHELTGEKVAKYTSYKKYMIESGSAQIQLELEKKFASLKSIVESAPQGQLSFGSNIVAEGLLKGIIKNCHYMQEIYNSHFEGKIPSECEKLNCESENRFGWVTSFDPAQGLEVYKNQYCEKLKNYNVVENKYLQEFQNPKESQLCGKKLRDFFSIKK